MGQEENLQVLQRAYASLTPREQQVLAKVVAGPLNKRIGADLRLRGMPTIGQNRVSRYSVGGDPAPGRHPAERRHAFPSTGPTSSPAA
ncbi:hypothetical protein CIW53_02795 [Rhodanobacter sp. T12-5]|nr:hypothetical protein CIW53_02795 [Rhodanobacter sp. T12-5]